jgi:hypothetical protein
MTAGDLKLMPWGQCPSEFGDWNGRMRSIEGVPVGPVLEEDVEEVLYHSTSGDRWDGSEVAVLRLRDGRYVAYETDWGPTGDGFSRDAYGGDADLWFAHGGDLRTLLLQALTDQGRRSVGLPADLPEGWRTQTLHGQPDPR